MFNKKYCRTCGGKVSKKHQFCSGCGTQISKEKSEEWGMLGKNDSIEETNFQNPALGGFSGKILNNMIGSVMKMLEKEMNKDMKNAEKIPKTNFKLMINGKEVNFNQQNKAIKKEPIKKIPRMEFKEKQLKTFSELPKEEPKTNLKRLADKIIYEMEMPEVKSFKDVLVNRLESSIEIKAIGKTKAYSKVIPINMPIMNQELSKGKLILELKED